MRLLNLFVFIISSDIVLSQMIRSGTLLQHRVYMIAVISKTMQEVEDYHWCNLKIPEFSQDFNYIVFGREISGHVTYKNGFVVSVQHLDIVQSSVQQTWRWDRVNQLGEVEVRGQLRLHDVVIGFDVEAVQDGVKSRYTSTFTHRLLSFNLNILKKLSTNETTVTVTGVNPSLPSGIHMMYDPSNEYSDILAYAFTPSLILPGILSWGPEIIQPRAYHVVKNVVDFPRICFNC